MVLETVIAEYKVLTITSSPRGNDRSPGSLYNVWRHHNLGCSKAGNSELETVIRNKFKHSRYNNANSGYLQILKRSEQKLRRKPGENIFFR